MEPEHIYQEKGSKHGPPRAGGRGEGWIRASASLNDKENQHRAGEAGAPGKGQTGAGIVTDPAHTARAGLGARGGRPPGSRPRSLSPAAGWARAEAISKLG